MLIDIWADTKGPGQCRSCHARIEWAQNTNEKWMPFDPPIVVMKTARNQEDGRMVETVDTTVSVPHFATCPEGRRWRRRRSA